MNTHTQTHTHSLIKITELRVQSKYYMKYHHPACPRGKTFFNRNYTEKKTPLGSPGQFPRKEKERKKIFCSHQR